MNSFSIRLVWHALCQSYVATQRARERSASLCAYPRGSRIDRPMGA